MFLALDLILHQYYDSRKLWHCPVILSSLYDDFAVDSRRNGECIYQYMSNVNLLCGLDLPIASSSSVTTFLVGRLVTLLVTSCPFLIFPHT